MRRVSTCTRFEVYQFHEDSDRFPVQIAFLIFDPGVEHRTTPPCPRFLVCLERIPSLIHTPRLFKSVPLVPLYDPRNNLCSQPLVPQLGTFDADMRMVKPFSVGKQHCQGVINSQKLDAPQAICKHRRNVKWYHSSWSLESEILVNVKPSPELFP